MQAVDIMITTKESRDVKTNNYHVLKQNFDKENNIHSFNFK